MKRKRNDEVAMNPWASQQIVRRVSFNDITRYLWLQIPNLTFELDLTHWMCTIGIEAIGSSLDGIQLMDENPQVLHDPTI